MLHLGDITKINGYTAPIVDVVVGGSPCQDLSVAGKRAGLDGERSGLFMEQLRVIKEMREHDRRIGRTGEFIRPRYMVWENVPGAFSSNKAEDFRIVLEETAKVIDKNAVIPMPDNGKWTTSGCILGDGWSIAWRVCDAQFYGVPQRRRRIALVADFGGHSAPEILFVRKSMSRDSEPSQPQRKEATSDASRSLRADDCIGVDIYNTTLTGDKACPLTAEGHTSTGTCPKVMTPTTFDDIFCIDGDKLNKQERKGGSGIGYREGDKQYTLTAKDVHGVAYSFEPGIAQTLFQPVCAYNIGDRFSVPSELAERSPTLTARCGTGGNNVPVVVCDKKPTECVVALDRSAYNQGKNAKYDIGIDENGTAHSLVAKGPGAVAYTIDEKCANTYVWEDQANTLAARDYKQPQTVVTKAYGFDQGATRDVGSLFLEEQSKTLTNGSCPGHHNGVCIAAVDCRNALENDVNGALQSNMAHSLNGNNVVRTKYIVRRLTPLECERLQGYPDGWTDIGEWTDSKGKVHKTSDAARYKALGNSIALPPWKWVLKRLCACYERDATTASLFDGIGGFPLIWEQLNGKGTCLWASEIEDFPIAVTKKRIGE